MSENVKIKNAIGHFKTITAHRRLVRKYCFRIGLYSQGLTHDLSKYSPSEFVPGAIYYEGDRSPNAKEREVKHYSSAWLHHKGRNKHHYEYWQDHMIVPRGKCGPVKMPRRYVAEMFCDRLAASHIYNEGHYEDRMPLDYFLRAEENMPMHPRTRFEIKALLTMCYEKGEDYTLDFIRDVYLK